MSAFLIILITIFLFGCTSTGYKPHYIISDTIEETPLIPEENGYSRNDVHRN